MNSPTVPLSNLPSQFANKDGSWNWWGFAIVGLSVAVMAFQIIDISRNWKIAKREKEQEDKINKMQTELAELKTLHQAYMPSVKEHDGTTKSFLSHLPTMNRIRKVNVKNFDYRGFSN